MEGIHQPRYVLTHRCDQEAGKQLAGFNVRGGGPLSSRSLGSLAGGGG